MILSGDDIRIHKPLFPVLERTRFEGVTYGLGPAGYDVRVAEDIVLQPGAFVLASTMEIFNMPDRLLGVVHDKSTWIRRGLMVHNTVIEPGWRGFLTLELQLHAQASSPVHLTRGVGIAQVLFHVISSPARPYEGKYQDQPAGPQPAIMEDK